MRHFLLDKHKEECPKKPTKCRYCGLVGDLKNYQVGGGKRRRVEGRGSLDLYLIINL